MADLEGEIRFGGVHRDPRGQVDRDGFLPVSSPLRRIATPLTVTFAGGRAMLMELAHPSIAQAVADFDHFQADPARRARLTVMAVVRALHGSEEVARGVGRHLAAVHARVNGPGYRASDPQLILWVHATFIDSLLRVAAPLGRRLTPAERAHAYEDAVLLGEVFGVDRSVQPASIEAFNAYVARTAAELEVSVVGRRLAAQVFSPAVPPSRQPVVRLYRTACVRALPVPLRCQYAHLDPKAPGPAWRAGRALSPTLAPVLDAGFRRVGRRGKAVSGTLRALKLGPMDPPPVER